MTEKEPMPAWKLILIILAVIFLVLGGFTCSMMLELGRMGPI